MSNKKSKYLENLIMIQKWMEERETEKPPAVCSKDEEEKKLGRALCTIRREVIKPYSLLKTEEERKSFEQKHVYVKEIIERVRIIDENKLTYLRHAREIEKWVKVNEKAKFPSIMSKDEKEIKLGNAIRNIREKLIKPYLQLKTEEEKEKYKKEHPEIDEVIRILQEIEENFRDIKLKQAKDIRDWMLNNKNKKLPLRNIANEDERKLNNAYRNLKGSLINPYLQLETEEEKEKYKKQHPELEKIMEVMQEINELGVPISLKNAREIKKWASKGRKKKFPSTVANNEYEKKLGWKLVNIRRGIINPYLQLETEEEKEKYKKQHPELEEVMEILYEIDNDNKDKMRTQKQEELFRLMEEDIEKRRKVKEARELEAKYEELVEQKIKKRKKIESRY